MKPSTIDVRPLKPTLTGPANHFQPNRSPPAKRVIVALDAELKQAIKGATESYLEAAEKLISGLGTTLCDAQLASWFERQWQSCRSLYPELKGHLEKDGGCKEPLRS